MNFQLLYEIVTSAGTLILFWIFASRIAHPFECQCGRRFWFARRAFRHIQQPHKYKE